MLGYLANLAAFALFCFLLAVSIALCILDWISSLRDVSVLKLFHGSIFAYATVSVVWSFLTIFRFDSQVNFHIEDWMIGKESLDLYILSRISLVFFMLSILIIMSDWIASLVLSGHLGTITEPNISKRRVVKFVVYLISGCFFVAYSAFSLFATLLHPFLTWQLSVIILSLSYFITDLISTFLCLLFLVILIISGIKTARSPDKDPKLIIRISYVSFTFLVNSLCFFSRSLIFLFQPICIILLSEEMLMFLYPFYRIIVTLVLEMIPAFLLLFLTRTKEEFSSIGNIGRDILSKYSRSIVPILDEALSGDTEDQSRTSDDKQRKKQFFTHFVRERRNITTRIELDDIDLAPVVLKVPYRREECYSFGAEITGLLSTRHQTLVVLKLDVDSVWRVYGKTYINSTQNSKTNLVEFFRTEALDGLQPRFQTLVLLPKEVQMVAFEIYAIENMNSDDLNSQVLLGKIEFTLVTFISYFHNRESVSFAMNSEELRLKLHFQGDKSSILVGNDISRHYKFLPFAANAGKDDDNVVRVIEEMVESRFSFVVPFEYISLIINERRAKAEEIEIEYREDVKSGGESLGGIQTFGDMMDTVVQSNNQKVNSKFLLSHSESTKNHLLVLEAAMTLYSDYRGGYKRLTFRPSTDKRTLLLFAIPLNLHIQKMLVGDSVYIAATVGAFAAHNLGFKDLGVRQLRQRYERHEKRMTEAVEMFEVNRIERKLREINVINDNNDLKFEISRRRDSIIPQALSTLISIVISMLETQKYGSSDEFASQLVEVGLLYYQESLLSTYGNEKGMLGDLDEAVKELHGSRFRIFLSNEGYDISLEYGPDRAYLILVGIPPSDYNGLSPILKNAGPILVHTILLTQGINEKQTLANKLGDTSLQDDINRENIEKLREYFRNYKEFYLESKYYDQNRLEQIEILFAELNDGLDSAKTGEKNVKLLIQASEFAHLANAARVISCKSGKDRTSMSITAIQAHFLLKYHLSSKSGVMDALRISNVMRASGVRRHNVKKNIGRAKYAFSNLQLAMLPEVYRAPRGMGSGKTFGHAQQ